MKILIIQNKMGIGDMVIYLPFIKAISEEFDTSVSILVKESSKAEQFLKNNNIINKIIILDRGNKKRNGRHDGLAGSYCLAKDLRQYNFDKVFIFNSSLRFNLITRIARIKDIYQYSLFQKKDQHVISAAKVFLKKKLGLNVKSDPEIPIDNQSVQKVRSKYKISNDEKNILLGIGGSGPTKRVPAIIFIKLMRLIAQKYKCKFFLATGKDKQEQEILKELLNSEFKDKCYALDNLNLTEILPIIKNCDISVCNDSSFSHLSSALGIKTIVLMADTPLLYGSYNSKMYPIIPDGESTVAHDTFGKEKINPNKIFDQLDDILS
ncbi:glycosyltransferase family 9 protein [Candidatus Pelagibacter sp. Uisw_099_02]|mgnify:FL=1|uniref:glycosyltransferase family 9 protein n=1 Tax=Candidatus Pelagibacter sp. Uisw_099_02 TaxID=3230981 RepID=UPI0023756944|nr:glycosyltransferase family 9 protein [Candidatus Pelagibacter sp.]